MAGVSPEATRVWLVREGRPEAVRGVLGLERHSLTFTPDDDEPLPIPTNRIRRVRRRRATPILEVTYTDARAEESRLFIYFARPPPLPGVSRESGRRKPSSWVIPTKGLEQTASAITLRAANRALKPGIEAWVRAIRNATGG
jgi:hypothetical protein